MSVSVRRARAAVAAVLLGGSLALQVVVATTASAHTELSTSDPSAGSTVDRVPAIVRLTFSEPVGQPLAVAVVAPDGSIVSTGAVETSGNVVSQRLARADAPGSYTISYRVTSLDGHALEGSVTFTLAGAAGGASAATGPAAGTRAPDPSRGTAAVVGLSLAFAGALGLVVLGLNLLRRDV